MAKKTETEPLFGDCRVAAQAVCHGGQHIKVMAVAGTASGNGQAHIAVRVGRVLVYVADREALRCFVAAWSQAERMGTRVFPEDPDVVWRAKQADRRHFERTGNLALAKDRRRTTSAAGG